MPQIVSKETARYSEKATFSLAVSSPIKQLLPAELQDGGTCSRAKQESTLNVFKLIQYKGLPHQNLAS